jgi:fused signal recognition particle receptor
MALFEKKSVFRKFIDSITMAVYDNPELGPEFLDQLEESLVMADVGIDTSAKIIEELNKAINYKYITREREIKKELSRILEELMDKGERNLMKDEYPLVILMIGINGGGKTTTIAKLANMYIQQGKTVMLAAADTFRAAAVEQIVIWGERVGVPVIKQQMGADPASVAFDTLSSAKANGADVVIIDTAGRLHNKVGLMNELKKIKDVMKKVMPEAPDEVLLVLDGSTGQNAFEQAKQFAAVTQISSLAITKLDGTAKGGVVIGISDQLKVPVKYIGLGEHMEDLQLFNRRNFVNSLFGN